MAKIADIQATSVAIPYDPPFRPAWAPGLEQKSRELTMVKLTTDEGVVGWGASPTANAAAILRQVRPYLIGEDLFATERHAPALRRAGGAWAVDMALWDAIGHTLGQPLYKLWGGYRDRILAYASTAQDKRPEERAEDALRYLQEGFRAIKLRAHYPTLKEDLRVVEVVRQAVGERLDLMVDANQAETIQTPVLGPVWDYARAKKAAQALDEYGVLWLEEPLHRYDLEGLRRLAAEVDIPIAGGEGNRGLHEFRWLIEQDAYDIIQPDATFCEGLFQLHKIAALAEMHYKLFIPHHGMGALGLAAHLHLSAAVPNSPWVEYMYDPPYRTIEGFLGMGGIVPSPPRIDAEGYVPVPQGPGLGLVVDERAVQRYAK